MSETQVYADSTVAMSLYNVLCRRGSPAAGCEQLVGVVLELALPDLGTAQAEVAWAELKRRGLVVPRGKGYDVADRRRRVVIGRDREDWALDPGTGKIQGGWNRWMVQDSLGRLDPLSACAAPGSPQGSAGPGTSAAGGTAAQGAHAAPGAPSETEEAAR
jgi:hypothetical protein